MFQFGDENSRQSVVVVNRNRRTEREELFGYRPVVDPPSPGPVDNPELLPNEPVDATSAGSASGPSSDNPVFSAGPAPYRVDQTPPRGSYHNIPGQRALPPATPATFALPSPSLGIEDQPPPTPPLRASTTGTSSSGTSSIWTVPSDLDLKRSPSYENQIEALTKEINWHKELLGHSSPSNSQAHPYRTTRNSFQESVFVEQAAACERVRRAALSRQSRPPSPPSPYPLPPLQIPNLAAPHSYSNLNEGHDSRSRLHRSHPSGVQDPPERRPSERDLGQSTTQVRPLIQGPRPQPPSSLYRLPRRSLQLTIPTPHLAPIAAPVPRGSPSPRDPIEERAPRSRSRYRLNRQSQFFLGTSPERLSQVQEPEEPESEIEAPGDVTPTQANFTTTPTLETPLARRLRPEGRWFWDDLDQN